MLKDICAFFKLSYDTNLSINQLKLPPSAVFFSGLLKQNICEDLYRPPKGKVCFISVNGFTTGSLKMRSLYPPSVHIDQVTIFEPLISLYDCVLNLWRSIFSFYDTWITNPKLSHEPKWQSFTWHRDIRGHFCFPNVWFQAEAPTEVPSKSGSGLLIPSMPLDVHDDSDSEATYVLIICFKNLSVWHGKYKIMYILKNSSTIFSASGNFQKNWHVQVLGRLPTMALLLLIKLRPMTCGHHQIFGGMQINHEEEVIDI